MMRYLKVYRKQIIVLILIAILAYISSVVKGKFASITAVAAGVLMIVLAIFFLVWIAKAPTKKDNNQIV